MVALCGELRGAPGWRRAEGEEREGRDALEAAAKDLEGFALRQQHQHAVERLDEMRVLPRDSARRTMQHTWRCQVASCTRMR